MREKPPSAQWVVASASDPWLHVATTEQLLQLAHVHYRHPHTVTRAVFPRYREVEPSAVRCLERRVCTVAIEPQPERVAPIALVKVGLDAAQVKISGGLVELVPKSLLVCALVH